MLRILSWSSGLTCDKIHDPTYNTFTPKQALPSVTELPLTAAVKRKRSFSCDRQTVDPLNTVANQTVDQCAAELVQANAVTHKPNETKGACLSVVEPTTFTPSTAMNSSLSNDSPSQTSSEARLKSMRQTISTQLNLEILVKHKELRLIDQEIAKCQVALEQLRRCSEIPYPATQQASIAVSEGKGAALRKPGERYPAKSPAPWGVTDGPYSRHYAKWLLPDSRFDGGEPDTLHVQNILDAAVPARSTRGSFVETGKSLKSRSTMRSGNFKSLPAGYGQPKEKATGPMILKRKSDDVMVKLVCPDCGRHDFGSAQGFINHCRIGHGRSFASHDAAAEACGEPVEYNDNGTMKGCEPVATPTTTNMHPLIRSAKLLPPTTNVPMSSRVTGPGSRRLLKPKSVATSPSFQPSTQTPHLSAMIQNQGLGLNLQDLVSEAKIKAEPPESDNEGDEMDIECPPPTSTGRHPQVAGSKQPVKSTASKQPSPLLHSRMRINENTSNQSCPVPRRQTGLSLSNDRPQNDFMRSLIPSPTNESTQAPSLVDDDEEFDPQSPLSSNDVDEAELDFDVHDDEQGERAVLHGGELPSPQGTCAPTSPARNHARRASTTGKTLGPRDEHKSIGVASPSPHPEGSDRKRRRIEGK